MSIDPTATQAGPLVASGSRAIVPRVRLEAVFTSRENPPFAAGQAGEHRWFEDDCSRSRRCAVECPPQTVLDEPPGRTAVWLPGWYAITW